MDLVNVPAKWEVHSFTRSWDNRGYLKPLGSSWICPRFLLTKIVNGLLFGLTLWMYRPNLKSVALPVPETIAAMVKTWGSPWICRSRSSMLADFGTNRKRVYDFLLIRNGNVGLSRTVLEILQVFLFLRDPTPISPRFWRCSRCVPDRPCWGQPEQMP